MVEIFHCSLGKNPKGHLKKNKREREKKKKKRKRRRKEEEKGKEKQNKNEKRVSDLGENLKGRQGRVLQQASTRRNSW